MIHSLTIVNNELVVDMYEISKYPILNKIYKRDITTTKEFARKELLYIHYIADGNGYCIKSGLTAKDAHEYAVANVGLSDKYKPDKDVKKAIELVKSHLNLNIIEDLINTTIKGFNLSGKLVTRVVARLEEAFDAEEYNDDDLVKAELNIKQLLKLASEIPSRIDTLTILRDDYEKQKNGTSVIRGGKDYTDSYDGDNFGANTSSKGIHLE